MGCRSRRHKLLGERQGFSGGSDGKDSTWNVGDLGSIPGLGRSLEEDMATHSSILPGKSAWTEKPGGLLSMGSQRVGHDWVTKHSTAFKGMQFKIKIIIFCFTYNSICSVFLLFKSILIWELADFTWISLKGESLERSTTANYPHGREGELGLR